MKAIAVLIGSMFTFITFLSLQERFWVELSIVLVCGMMIGWGLSREKRTKSDVETTPPGTIGESRGVREN